MTENEAHKVINNHKSFRNFMYVKHHIHQGIIEDKETGEIIRYYEEDYGKMPSIQLVGYLLDYLYSEEDNKVLLYMGSDIIDKFIYLVSLIAEEEKD